MTLVQYLFGSGSEGTALTTPNTGAASQSFNSGTGVFAAAVKGNGSSFGGKYTNALNQQTFQRYNLNAANNAASFRGRCTLPAGTSNNSLILWRLRNSTGNIMSLLYSTTGSLWLNDSTGTTFRTIATAATLASAGITGGSQFEITEVVNVSAGTVTTKLYTTGGTQVGSTFNDTSISLGASNATAFDVGILSTNNNAGSVVGWADLQVNDGSSSELSTISPTNTPPTVTVSGNQNVAAGALVHLTSTATDSDGTVVSRAWTYDLPTSGAPSFTAPTSANTDLTAGSAGDLYIARHTATDDAAAAGSASTEVRVPLTSATDARTVPNAGQAVGSWTRVGTGVTSDADTVNDESDSTYLESPVLNGTTETSKRFRWQPKTASATATVSLKLAVDTGTPTLTIRLIEGTTTRQTWTQAVTTTATGYTFTVSSPGAITDWGNLFIEIAGT